MKKVRVLLVDDSTYIRTVLGSILAEAGFEVVDEAADGEEAIRKYMNLKPDVVLMDVVMEPMGGKAATQAILDKDSAAKILMVTVLEDKNILVDLVNMGAKGYITKPFSKEEITEKIKEIMEGY
ncbi:MAG: Chemotaxis protein CheY [Candidatus Methanophagaceae archaeon]|jgi:two-component system chemotaxis response regulator CheY|nr:MAG: Chemotaxis protein CheY [Methanophagales archaeon]KAF5431314.1 two-component system, chemotaxis family, response regulator CheY [Methanophagales archaeon]KAF5436359.1 two-component system, chemotaxis family, response regulator CheY [Methanophagales archaeon]